MNLIFHKVSILAIQNSAHPIASRKDYENLD
jgi:hypothetical protein